MSQTELARRLGATKQSISRLERGAVAPSLGRLGRIADILDVHISRFFVLADQERKAISAEIFHEIETGLNRAKKNGLYCVMYGLAEMSGLATGNRSSEGPDETIPPSKEKPSVSFKTVEEMREWIRQGGFVTKTGKGQD